MKTNLNTVIVILFCFVSVGFSEQVTVGINKNAPDFTLKSTSGEKVSLSDYRGKYVVLEWINLDCPFVRKHYNSNNMQNIQKRYTDRGVIWLSINSSAKGRQGDIRGEELTRRLKSHKVAHTAYLHDTDGRVGKMYQAKTTPHMYIINPDGVLIYAGAIDNRPSTDVNDINGAINYVTAAFDKVYAGEKVETQQTRAYGCSVKY